MRKKQSMEEIYLENRHWVYGSFLRKTGEIETAEDLSQTLWLRFFQNYENLNLPNEKVVRAYSLQHDFACGSRLLAQYAEI